LHVFNTHLQASYSGGKYTKGSHGAFEARLNQQIELGNYIHKTLQNVTTREIVKLEKGEVQDKHSFIVSGDFNVRGHAKYHPSVVEWKLKCDNASKWIWL
jgi:hypothetical protein